MQDQSQNLTQLKKSLKNFIHEINHLLVLYEKDHSNLTKETFHKIFQIINQIESSSKELAQIHDNNELVYNTQLIKGLLNQEFYINKANTKKTSLIALKTLEEQSQSIDDFKQMLKFWANEKHITQVLFDDIYNIINELAI